MVVDVGRLVVVVEEGAGVDVELGFKFALLRELKRVWNLLLRLPNLFRDEARFADSGLSLVKFASGATVLLDELDELDALDEVDDVAGSCDADSELLVERVIVVVTLDVVTVGKLTDDVVTCP